MARSVAYVAAAICVMVVPGATVAADRAAPRRPPTLGQLTTDLYRASGATAVIAYRRTPRAAFLAARGFADPATRARARPSAKIRIGSITKTFVAAVTLQLVSEGALSLDDPVAKWRPGLLPSNWNVTVRELLSHRSGLFDYSRDADFLARAVADRRATFTPDELVGYATRHPLDFPPGTSSSYSNTNFIVLGLVVEAVTGRAIADEIRKRVVDRLGLRDTFLLTSPEIPGFYAHVVSRETDTSVVDPSRSWAAAGMVSTVPDLARFFRALYNGKLFPMPLVREMQKVTGRSGTWGLGLGMLVTRLHCGNAFGQDGFVDGYFTWAKFNRDGSRGAIVTIVSSVGDARARVAFLNAAFCRK